MISVPYAAIVSQPQSEVRGRWSGVCPAHRSTSDVRDYSSSSKRPTRFITPPPKV